MNNTITNQKTLDGYISSYTPFNDWLITRRYKELEQYFKGDTCLELGSAEGMGTGFLLDHFSKVVAVDGSKLALDEVERRFKTDRLETVHAFFEEIDLGGRLFDTIVLAHILEHVDDPSIVLTNAKKFLKKDGVIIIDVPNGHSLHRQVGVEMGLLNKETDLNDADLSIGHQRVYIPETFKKDIETAGLKISQYGGMFIKVLSNSQTEKVFSEEQCEALFKIGIQNPDIAAEIFAVAGLS